MGGIISRTGWVSQLLGEIGQKSEHIKDAG